MKCLPDAEFQNQECTKTDRQVDSKRRSSPKVIWKEPRRHPSRQKMNSPAACASCAMPTADESNHSAARYATSTPHGHNDGIYHASRASRDENTSNSHRDDI